MNVPCHKLVTDGPIRCLNGHCCCDCGNAWLLRSWHQWKVKGRVCVLDMRGGMTPDDVYVIERAKHGICEFWTSEEKHNESK